MKNLKDFLKENKQENILFEGMGDSTADLTAEEIEEGKKEYFAWNKNGESVWKRNLL